MLAEVWFLAEKSFFSESVRKSRQKLYKALEKMATVRLHALRMRSGSHRVLVQMDGLSLSPIASSTYPS